jgi:TPR repeat protein
MPDRRWRAEIAGCPAPAGGSLERVACSLGERSEREGDLERAARWYRRAAEAGCAEAALRLGDVLGRLADEGRTETDDSPEQLLAEASRWLSEVRYAARPDGIELVTDMLNRHQRLAARRGFEPEPVG